MMTTAEKLRQYLKQETEEELQVALADFRKQPCKLTLLLLTLRAEAYVVAWGEPLSMELLCQEVDS